MYIYSYQPLKDRLKKRLVTDHEALPYLLWFCGLQAVAFPSPGLSEMNKWDIIGTLLYVTVTVLGVFCVYRKNGGETGYDVIHKIVVLGSVVAIRYLLAAVPVGGLVYLTAYHYGLSGTGTTFFDVVFFTAIYALYYERLGRHIADTNERNREKVVPSDLQETAAASGELRLMGGRQGKSNRGRL